jgi:hypothetical protein
MTWRGARHIGISLAGIAGETRAARYGALSSDIKTDFTRARRRFRVFEFFICFVFFCFLVPCGPARRRELLHAGPRTNPCAVPARGVMRAQPIRTMLLRRGALACQRPGQRRGFAGAAAAAHPDREELLRRLRAIDTAALCDADKATQTLRVVPRGAGPGRGVYESHAGGLQS